MKKKDNYDLWRKLINILFELKIPIIDEYDGYIPFNKVMIDICNKYEEGAKDEKDKIREIFK